MCRVAISAIALSALVGLLAGPAAAQTPSGPATTTATAGYFDCIADSWGKVSQGPAFGRKEQAWKKCLSLSYCGVDSLVISGSTAEDWEKGDERQNQAFEFIFEPGTFSKSCASSEWVELREYSAFQITFRRSEPKTIFWPLELGALRCLVASEFTYLYFSAGKTAGIIARLPASKLTFSRSGGTTPALELEPTGCKYVRDGLRRK